MTCIHHYTSPLGGITLAGDRQGLTGLWFDGQKYFGSTLPAEYNAGELPVFAEADRWLSIYFSGKDPGFTPPLRLMGTEFQKAVWALLLAIPFGQTTTYKQIAQEIARQKGRQTMSAQAVGGAVGHNPVSLIIPCHRVVGSSGSLTGYAGGIDKKGKLLLMEKGLAEKADFAYPRS